MEKKEKENAQNLQNGDCTHSPNTRRRLKLLSPKLHLKLPFMKRGHNEKQSPISPLERVQADELLLSSSLPSESHMPSNIHEAMRGHTHDCENRADTLCSFPCDEVFTSRSVEDDTDEADSEKHQSDLDENEKDNAEEPETVSGPAADKAPASGTTEDGATPTRRSASPDPTTRPRLKSCLKGAYHGRRRASTFPGLDGECLDLEGSFKRCVRFSPDTVEPTPRNCRYREWIERNCLHPKSPPVDVKHEKRKCQLNQMRKVNISDYMSKNYGSSFFSPIGSYGGDMIL